jgi:hypothetical protein
VTFGSDVMLGCAIRRRKFDVGIIDQSTIARMHLHFWGFASVARGSDGNRMRKELRDQALGR